MVLDHGRLLEEVHQRPLPRMEHAEKTPGNGDPPGKGPISGSLRGVAEGLGGRGDGFGTRGVEGGKHGPGPGPARVRDNIRR